MPRQTMDAAQFRAAIKKLGLSQQKAGQFFGYSGRQGQRWASDEDETCVPPAVAFCLRLMLKHKVEPTDLDKDFR